MNIYTGDQKDKNLINSSHIPSNLSSCFSPIEDHPEFTRIPIYFDGSPSFPACIPPPSLCTAVAAPLPALAHLRALAMCAVAAANNHFHDNGDHSSVGGGDGVGVGGGVK